MSRSEHLYYLLGCIYIQYVLYVGFSDDNIRSVSFLLNRKYLVFYVKI